MNICIFLLSILLSVQKALNAKCEKTYHNLSNKNVLRLMSEYPQDLHENCIFTFPAKKNQAIQLTIGGDNITSDEIFMIFENTSITPLFLGREYEIPTTVYVPKGVGLRMNLSQPRDLLVSRYIPNKDENHCQFPILNVTDTYYELDISKMPESGCSFRLQAERNIFVSVDCAVCDVLTPGNSTYFMRHDSYKDFIMNIIQPNVDVRFIPKKKATCTATISSMAPPLASPCDLGIIPLNIRFSSPGIDYSDKIFPPALFQSCPELTVHYQILCKLCIRTLLPNSHYCMMANVVPRNSEIVVSKRRSQLLRLTSSDGPRRFRMFIPGIFFQVDAIVKRDFALSPERTAGYHFLPFFMEMENECTCPPLTLNDSLKGISYTAHKKCLILTCFSKLPSTLKARIFEITYQFEFEQYTLTVMTADNIYELTASPEHYELQSLARYFQFQDAPRQMTFDLPANRSVSFMFEMPRTWLNNSPPGSFSITWHDVDK